MTLPKSSFGEATDEAGLLSIMEALGTSAGLTVTTTGLVKWFQGSGEDGCHNVVFGALDTGANRLEGRAAADFDGTDGFTNDDTSGSQPAPITAPAGISDWPARDGGSKYFYRMAVDRGGICVLVDYVSGGAPAQSLFYGGMCESHQRKLYRQACALIFSVGAGSIGSQRLITLDRNINAALKDGSVFGSDVQASSAPLFQSITGGAPASDAYLTERAPIVASSLGLDGSGRTQFEVTVDLGAGTSKLFLSAANGGRYANNRGAGDAVRLAEDPTVVVCGGSTTKTNILSGTNQAMIAAWDAWGGQASNLDVIMGNRWALNVAEHAGDKFTGQHNYYKPYITMNDNEDAILVQANNEGRKTVGTLPLLSFLANNSIPGFTLVEIDYDTNRKHMVMEVLGSNGMRAPGGFTDVDVCYMAGPGF